MIDEQLDLKSPVIAFRGSLTETDPVTNPVLVIGQMKHLSELDFGKISVKFGKLMDKKMYDSGLQELNPSSADSVHVWLNKITLAVLPKECSRHNTPSRAHAISKLVKDNSSKSNEFHIVMVCERKDVIASACAIAKSFPVFTRKTTKNSNKISKVQVEFLLVPNSDNDPVVELNDDDLGCISSLADSVRFTAKIVDVPCNEMNVDTFIQQVEFIGKLLNIEPVIIRGEELNERGMGGIYGVGKAATSPPALVVLSHRKKDALNTIAWVGKGIVYDTGGLSIKTSSNMPGMKRDCGGASAILGAFYTAVKADFNQNLHAIFCLAENSVGSRSTRPDDIHTLYSGSTVEVNNTDAEGRLVVSDGVAYAKKDLEANVIVDMATLTGAQGVATGKYHGAILSNNEDWEKSALSAGLSSGDLVFPVPYCPELHFSEYKSQVADMKNSVSDRSNAQVSCAGLFIGSNIGFDFPGIWLHVDMASPAYSGERATGYGVALLVTLFGSLCDKPIIQSIAPKLGLKH